MLTGFAKSNKGTVVGLLLEFGPDWMGGVNYLVNLIKTINVLPPEKVPSLVMIVDPRVESNYQECLQKLENIQVEYIWVSHKLISSIPFIGKFVTKFIRIIQVTRIVKKYHIDCLFPVMRKGDLFIPTSLIGWIPDFQHINFPEFFSKREIKKRNHSTALFAKKCSYIIFSSVNAKQDFERFFPYYQSKNFVYSFHTVLEKESQITDFPYLSVKYQLNRKFIYLPNQFWVHKNHLVVFKALAFLLQKGQAITLVCTGVTSDYRNEKYYKQLINFIDQNGLHNNIKILGLVPRNDQFSLYYYAHAIIQPSLSEGWSSIVEDAKAFQKMLIVSDIPVHHEQCPANAIFFNPVDYEELAGKINDVWEEPPRKQLAFNELCKYQDIVLKQTANSLAEFFKNC